jgi:cyclophilin family peptidyl-prolyl cis-trans isomerase
VLLKLGNVLALTGMVALLFSGCSAKPTATPPRPTDRPKKWSSPPPMSIDPSKTYHATFQTAKGDIKVELLAKQAPKTVNNLVFLARAGFYDNTTFHRVLEDFMAQGGDPTGTGSGGPGYRFEDEIDPSLQFDRPGLLAMANAGANTNGSQFFLTFVPTPWLNGKHTIFGRVVSGMDVLLSLTLRDPQKASGPGDLLKTIVIDEQ